MSVNFSIEYLGVLREMWLIVLFVCIVDDTEDAKVECKLHRRATPRPQDLMARLPALRVSSDVAFAEEDEEDFENEIHEHRDSVTEQKTVTKVYEEVNMLRLDLQDLWFFALDSLPKLILNLSLFHENEFRFKMCSRSPNPNYLPCLFF